MDGKLTMRESHILRVEERRTTRQIAGGISKVIRKILASFVGDFHRMRNLLIAKELLHSRYPPNQIDNSAHIHPTANIASRGVIIRKNCEIGPHVVIFENSIIDDEADIGPGTVIGSQSYNCIKHGSRITPIRAIGGVMVHKSTRIQSNCSIDRALKEGFTEIKTQTNLESAIHVAHDAIIGERCIVRSGSMIGGHAVIGDDAVVGLNSSISNRISISNGAVVRDGAVVTKDVKDGEIVSGNFAIDSDKHQATIKSIIQGNPGDEE